MNLRNLLFITAAGCLISTSHAQEIYTNADSTNSIPLYTKLENFEARTDTMIVKGTAAIGAVTANTGVISVWCKESQDISRNEKAYGIAIGVRASGKAEDVTILDYDELDSFLASIDFVTAVDGRVSPLPAFSAGYTSKGGLKLSAYTSNKHVGTIPVALQSNHAFKSRIVLAHDELEKFKVTMQQAKAQLDTLRESKN